MRPLANMHDESSLHPVMINVCLYPVSETGFQMQAVDSVADGIVQRSFANVRPPGHHAACSCISGFCFYNNVAIAARTVAGQGKAGRVLIVDWDVCPPHSCCCDPCLRCIRWCYSRRDTEQHVAMTVSDPLSKGHRVLSVLTCVLYVFIAARDLMACLPYPLSQLNAAE